MVATDLHFLMKLAKKDGSWIVEYQHVKMRSGPIIFQPARTFSR
jgi:hypothetical protein